MYKTTFASFLFMLLCVCNFTFSQTNIGGVINDYEGIVTIIQPGCNQCDQSLFCLDEIVVLDPSAFSVGDKALIIQMKGASINETNTVSGGTITDIGNAGNYEFFDVGGIVGNNIYPTAPLRRTYDTAGLVQIVRVPYYPGDVNITSTITADPWDPLTNEGGVVALFVEGTLTLNADIDAGEIGYRGVTVSVNGSPDNCGTSPNTQFIGPSTDNDKSPKGNGIVLDNPLFNGGRSPRGNGGGGGVSGGRRHSGSGNGPVARRSGHARAPTDCGGQLLDHRRAGQLCSGLCRRLARGRDLAGPCRGVGLCGGGPDGAVLASPQGDRYHSPRC